MLFGKSKCNYFAIYKRKIVESQEVIVMSWIAVKLLEEEDSYKDIQDIQDKIAAYVKPTSVTT